MNIQKYNEERLKTLRAFFKIENKGIKPEQEVEHTIYVLELMDEENYEVICTRWGLRSGTKKYFSYTLLAKQIQCSIEEAKKASLRAQRQFCAMARNLRMNESIVGFKDYHEACLYFRLIHRITD